MTIIFKENMQIPANVIDELITGVGSDIRQVLNMLSTWKLHNDSMDYEEGKSLCVQFPALYFGSPSHVSQREGWRKVLRVDSIQRRTKNSGAIHVLLNSGPEIRSTTRSSYISMTSPSFHCSSRWAVQCIGTQYTYLYHRRIIWKLNPSRVRDPERPKKSLEAIEAYGKGTSGINIRWRPYRFSHSWVHTSRFSFSSFLYG